MNFDPKLFAPVSNPAHARRLLDLAQDIASYQFRENTKRGYASDWRDFKTFCDLAGSDPAADEGLLIMYFTYLVDRGLKLNTILRRRLALIWMFKESGIIDRKTNGPFGGHPLRKLFKGIRRMIGAPPVQKRAADLDVLKAMLKTVQGDDLKSIRDRAILLIGFSAALRRSEIVSLLVSNIKFEETGIRITIVGSKTDRENVGQTVAIMRGQHPETCPVQALQLWLESADIRSGRVFRTVWLKKSGEPRISDSMNDRSVVRIIKDACAAAGYDASEFSGHSLRAGLVTQAARNDVPVHVIQETTRHTDVRQVYTYIRIANIFEAGASGRVGL